MKPIDKASELIGQFREWTYDSTMSEEANNLFARECAKIVANEALEIVFGNEGHFTNQTEKFWNQVIEEIDKL